MSVKAKIIIDDKEINVLSFSFGFNQGADTNGRPSQKTVFVGLQLVIETRKDLSLADWAFASNQTKQLELHIYPVILGGKTRKLYFYDCHLINWNNHFSSTGNLPMSETLHITATGVKDSNSTAEYSAYWRVTFEQNNIESTSIEEVEPRLIEYHFKNKKGEIIEEKNIKPNQEIELIIITEDTQNTTMKIDLNNSRLNFIHNGEIVENDILRGVKIYEEETRVPLTAIKQ